MMYGFIAITALIHYWSTTGEKAKAFEPVSLVSISDYTLRCDEISYHKNELDEIELRVQEIETDLKIKDSISHLRNAAYKKELQYLYNEIDRHNKRLDEIEY